MSFNFLFRELSFSSLEGVELDFLTRVFFLRERERERKLSFFSFLLSGSSFFFCE